MIARAERRRQEVSSRIDAERRNSLGQVLTPAPVAQFLASLLDLPQRGTFRLLDPGAGIGNLTAAVVARAIRERPELTVVVTTFEVDPELGPALGATLADCQAAGAVSGVEVMVRQQPQDFIVWATNELATNSTGASFDACVMNPPYRKIDAEGSQRRELDRRGVRVPNLYSAFLALAAELLVKDGQLSAVTPRSFANGPYFEAFRKFFLSRMRFDRIHVFEKRGHLFSEAGVLQENIVFRATRGAPGSTAVLSTSQSHGDLISSRQVAYTDVVRKDDPHAIVRLPVEHDGDEIAAREMALDARLPDLNIEVSTGRVVAFRTRANLRMNPSGDDTVPLIYPHHMRSFGVEWPRRNSKKPNALARSKETEKLLLPNETYVLVKRFTSKEERRRVVAAVSRAGDLPGEWVAFENHLNVFHCGGRGIDVLLAQGLATFLNSTIVDRYVRQFSGHTQINATDLRLLRYPSRAQLTLLGHTVETGGWPTSQAEIDAVVAGQIPAFANLNVPLAS